MKLFNHTTVFIVDDEKLFTSVLKNGIISKFELEDLAVSVFESGEECELALNEHPDIAIIDFHANSRYTGGMNGLALIDCIKAKSPNTEIIMFTREQDLDLARKALEHGVYDYILKDDFMFDRLTMSFRRCQDMLALKRDLKTQRNRSLFAAAVIVALLGIVTTIELFAPQLL